MAGENYGFQSTHSLRSATGLSNLLRWRASRFNPRTPCGVRQDGSPNTAHTTKFQSTHSLRSATEVFDKLKSVALVSIHALLAECDLTPCQKARIGYWFQSTHSLRSATGSFQGSRPSREGFNPRTPCGVRPMPPPPKTPRCLFHSARTWGCATCGEMLPLVYNRFQSTHSLRSATPAHPRIWCGDTVSIHALLAECDFGAATASGVLSSFNPRTPCGVRPSAIMGSGGSRPFQSTHSLRSATGAVISTFGSLLWFQSTHSLRSATRMRKK